MQQRLSNKLLSISALLVGVQIFTGCASSMAIRPSYPAPRAAKTIQQDQQQNLVTTKSAKKPICIPISRASMSAQPESETSNRYIEGDPESYVMSQANGSSPILLEAPKYLGTRYQPGGTGPNGFDCSGFVWKVYSTAGIELTRGSAGDYFGKGDKIDRREATPGDMVFFRDHGRINHVGIYLGEDRFIHSSSGRGVIESSMNESYWHRRVAGFRRFGS